MKKVLVINTIGLNYEGITSVIFNYSSYMCLTDMQLEFVAFDNINPDLKKKFKNIGAVHVLPNRKKNFKGYIKALHLLLKRKYDVIHIHGNSGTMVIETLFARLHGISKIMIHSHNTTCNHIIIHKILRVPMLWFATDYLACSDIAGKWLYGNKKYIVLNNAINLNTFSYNECVRAQVRNELEVGEELLIGHMGHFTEQKNHTFLIDVFNEYHKLDSLAKLLLVSAGPKFDEIKDKVHSLGLQDVVIFAGRRSDPERLYQAMDLFILPSMWEGLPVVMLEAQAAGLPVLASDAITAEAKCTSRTVYMSLLDGAKKWAEEIKTIANRKFDRKESVDFELKKYGFDIEQEAAVLRDIYFS